MCFNIIVHQSKKLTGLIEQLLDLSRIERANKRYYLKEGNLALAIAETVGGYAQHLRQQGFSVETDMAHDVPFVRFDPDAVSQAVMNLLDNARKYSGETKFIAVRLWSGNGKVIFEVEDHGIGIPEEIQKKIFQHFYRAKGSPLRNGHGLGLFLVRHIMHAHGGNIEVNSGKNQGTRFRLVFPVAGTQTVFPFWPVRRLKNTLHTWGEREVYVRQSSMASGGSLSPDR